MGPPQRGKYKPVAPCGEGWDLGFFLRKVWGLQMGPSEHLSHLTQSGCCSEALRRDTDMTTCGRCEWGLGTSVIHAGHEASLPTFMKALIKDEHLLFFRP